MKNYNAFKLSAIAATGLLLVACNQPVADVSDSAEKPLSLEDDASKASYAIGVSAGQSLAQNIATLDGTDISVDTDIVIKAFSDGVKGTSQLDDEALQTVMNDFRGRVNEVMQAKRKVEQEQQAKVAEENLTKGATFLSEHKGKEGVKALESGLQYKVLTAGSGKSPSATDRVKVHYKGTLIDGSQFDSSYDRGEPATFGVNQVIKGWTEALQLMKEGAKWQLVIPAELAYGSAARPTIPGNSVLLFDVELLEVIAPEKPAE